MNDRHRPGGTVQGRGRRGRSARAARPSTRRGQERHLLADGPGGRPAMHHRVANLQGPGQWRPGRTLPVIMHKAPRTPHSVSARLRRRRPWRERLCAGITRRGAPLGLGRVPVRERPGAAASGPGRAGAPGTQTGPWCSTQAGSSRGAVSTTPRFREIGDLDRGAGEPDRRPRRRGDCGVRRSGAGRWLCTKPDAYTPMRETRPEPLPREPALRPSSGGTCTGHRVPEGDSEAEYVLPDRPGDPR